MSLFSENSNSNLQFKEAQKLQDLYYKCEEITNHSSNFADACWLPDNLTNIATGHFRDTIKHDSGPHIINTSTALAIIARPDTPFEPRGLEAFNGLDYRSILQYYSITYKDPANEIEYWNAHDEKWSPYVSAWALHAIALCSEMAGDDQTKEHFPQKDLLPAYVGEQVKMQIDFLKDWIVEKNPNDYFHPYFIVTTLRALNNVKKAIPSEFIDESYEEYDETKRNCVRKLELEFYRQMTFSLAGVPQNLDAVSLTLSLITLLDYEEDNKENNELPEDVLLAALKTIFSLQHLTGLWETSTPLLGTSRGLVGCSSVELARRLLRTKRIAKYTKKYINNYVLLLDYLLLGFNSESPESGWATDIRRKGNAKQTWFGIMCFDYIYLIAIHLREIAADILLEDFYKRDGKPPITFGTLLDYKGYKQRLENSIVNPRAKMIKAATKEELKELKKQAKCSLILFGPPGTGKTTIAWTLADALNWRLIEIGPGDFLKNGLDSIFSQGNELFKRLMLVDRAVILFDEVDELVLERTENEEQFSRFLTTFMLPWIQRLRDRAEVVFIFATNHLKRFDPAVKRHGRFDMILPIGPPQGEDRQNFLNTTLKIECVTQELMEKIPPQATLGDLCRAYDYCIEKNNGEFNTDIFVSALSEDKLLVSSLKWTAFLEESKSFHEDS